MDVDRRTQTLGLALLTRTSMDAAALQGVWTELVARVSADPQDAGALLDLSTLLLASGDRAKGLEVQAAALAQQAWYRRPPREPVRLRLLAFMAPGDFLANTPLDFLLEESGVELISYYLDGPPAPAAVPDHDVAFLAIGQADEAAPLLARLDGAFDAWPRPVLNNRPALISELTRDGVADRFAGDRDVLSPLTVRTDREALAAVAAGTWPPGALAAGLDFPLIARPVGTHAGKGMAKLDGAAELASYLAGHPEPEFYVAEFIDYRSPDGLFRKLRIVFIRGRPFLSHMAISQHWMVHYLNADMEQSATKREEEAAMMADFEQTFAARHAAGFKALTEALPMDYFGIDCAEAPDGRLLVFEADVAMIVHAMDPEALFPYKKPAMAKLFTAFVAALEHVAEAGARLARQA